MKKISRIVAITRPGRDRSEGRLHVGGIALPCRIGPAGAVRSKREGDGGTPVGRWRIIAMHWRADRLHPMALPFPARVTRRDDGWCDDPASHRYNRAIRIPSRLRHETMWRQDGVYDIVLLLNHNTRPRVLGAGSAIFLHLTRDAPAPTAGCIAIPLAAMRRLLPRLSSRCIVEVR